jgi:hypothetical protein
MPELSYGNGSVAADATQPASPPISPIGSLGSSDDDDHKPATDDRPGAHGAQAPALNPSVLPSAPPLEEVDSKVFLAKDVKLDKMGVKMTISSAGIRVEGATNSSAAFPFCCSKPPSGEGPVQHFWQWKVGPDSRMSPCVTKCRSGVRIEVAPPEVVNVNVALPDVRSYTFTTKKASEIEMAWTLYSREGRHLQTNEDHLQKYADLKAENERAEKRREDKDEEAKRREEERQGLSNIKQRLDDGAWRHKLDCTCELCTDGDIPWWGGNEGNKSKEANILRTMSLVRDAWDETLPSGEPTFGHWPELVVVGDVSTGKSTVLNRFAQFDFSAADEALCTRRPIRLQLRPLSSGNRERFERDQLEAICTVEDREAEGQMQVVAEIDFRESEKGVGRQALKQIVAERNHKEEDVSLRTAEERHDSKYTQEELIITIESDKMIHFDLVDLPGVENDSPMTEKLIKNYINAATYRHTFVLIFQGADRGDTRMQTSLCLRVIKDLQREITGAAGQGGQEIREWMQEHCLGVLTKLDKRFEIKSTPENTQARDSYNARYAQQLVDDLMCNNHEPHMSTTFPWVAVLNPNAEERQAMDGTGSMDFKEALLKEKWFFEEMLRQDHQEHENKCGILCLRSILVDNMASFMVRQCRGEYGVEGIAQKVFDMVADEEDKITQQWGWTPDEELYHDHVKLKEVLHSSVDGILNGGILNGGTAAGPRQSLSAFSVEKVLKVPEFCEAIQPSSTWPPPESVDLQPVNTLIRKLGDRVRQAARENEYRRFPMLVSDLEEACQLIACLCETSVAQLLSAEMFRAAALEAQGASAEICRVGVCYAMQKKLVDVAELITTLRRDQSIPFELLEHGLSRELRYKAMQVIVATPLSPRVAEPLGDIESSQLCERMPVTTKTVTTGLHRSDRHTGPCISERAVEQRAGVDLSEKGNLLVEWIAEAVRQSATRTQQECTLALRLQQLVSPSPQSGCISGSGCETELIDYSNPVVLSDDEGWLLPQQLDPEYNQQRAVFMRHRRAAELLRLVFSDASDPTRMVDGKDWPRGREKFDKTKAATNPLVRLGHWASPFQGTGLARPSPQPGEPTMARSMIAQCSTPGCSRTHDAACVPCGHAACCWECLDQIHKQHARCPVCNVPIIEIIRCYEAQSATSGFVIRKSFRSSTTQAVQPEPEPEPEPELEPESV